MLVSCKPGCKKSKTGSTNIKLDLSNNKTFCEACGDEIETSVFIKNSLKNQNKVFKPEPVQFKFDCLTCNKKVDTILNSENEPVGKGCSKECKINISIYTKNALKQIKIVDTNYKKEEGENDK